MGPTDGRAATFSAISAASVLGRMTPMRVAMSVLRTRCGLALVLVVAFLVWLAVGRPQPADWVDTVGRGGALIVTALVALPAAYITFKRQQGLEHQNAIERGKYAHDRAKELQRRDELRQEATRDRRRLDNDEAREAQRREEFDANARREQIRDLQGRFVTAAGMLGDDKAAVRIAGVTALATLADDWIDQPDIGAESAHRARAAITGCQGLKRPSRGRCVGLRVR